MPTRNEYAALSANVYNDQRGGGGDSLINKLVVPPGWINLAQLGFTTGTSLVENNPFSFTAGAYLNTATGEIVVAYKGTDFLVEMSSRAYDTAADLVTDAGLALTRRGLGVYNAQQLLASSYFLTVKDWAVSNGYDASKISFTGHSLGAGLASNMAAWFDRRATVFADAPFELATVNPVAITAAAATLTLQAGVTASFAVLEEINRLRNLVVPGEYARREAGVTNYFVRGEMLEYLRAIWPTTMGADIPIDIGSQPVSRSVALHSMNLHAAFLFDDRLRDLTTKLPLLVPELLDTKLYASDPNSRTRDFITTLVSDQLRQGLSADSALKHFSGDLLKLTQYGARLKEGALGKALIDVTIADYYFMQSGFTKDFITGITGGIAFDLKDIGTNWATNKAVMKLDDAVAATLGLGILDRSALTKSNYWSIQSGTEALNAVGSGTNNDAMLGGALVDVLDGGAGNDFLFGGDEADTLTGGAGDDYLIGGAGDDSLSGGAGFDTYLIQGRDTISDADGHGILRNREGGLISGVIAKAQDGSYFLVGDSSISVTLGTNLSLGLADGSTVTIENFQSGNLSFQVVEDAVPSPTTRTIVGDLVLLDTDDATAGDQLEYDDLGNPVQLAGQIATGFADRLNDSAGNDHITPFAGDDDVNAYDGGNDRIQLGDGNDFADGGSGNDLVEGESGADVVAGGAGDDRVYADAAIELDDAIADSETAVVGGNAQWTDGGAGDDVLIASTSTDMVMGGGGSDVLVGGVGDDILHGDSGRQFVQAGWSVARVTVTTGSGGNLTTTYQEQFTNASTELATDGAADALYGGAGSDWLYGETGDDLLDAGSGADVAFGGDANDTILGRSGADTLNGEAGDDFADGGDDDDKVSGGAGADAHYGGAGNDAVYRRRA